MSLTPAERAAMQAFLARQPVWSALPGPQSMVLASDADVIGFGGSAGGGKTDLICGLGITEHTRVLVLRREKAQTDGIVQRLAEIVGSTDGYNSQKSAWRIPVGSSPLVEFGGLDNPGDERRWQGRPHDLVALDEATEMRESQVRFVLGWARTQSPRQRVRVVMTFNPPTTAEGRWILRFFAPWLDPKHPKPAQPGELRWFTTIGDEHDYEVADGRAFIVVDGRPCYDFDADDFPPESIIVPKSRTFIPSRVTDNPYYVRSGYIAQLQSLPEPLRSQMLHGDFAAGVEDDAFAVFPTGWVEAAQARWKQPDKLPPMDSVGADIARGGKDRTVIITRHGQWYSQPKTYPGTATPDGPTAGALIMAAARDRARLHVDVIGVGSSPVDWLRERDQPVIGVNVSNAATQADQTGLFTFSNLRSQLMWKLREALDPSNNTGIALPPVPELAQEMAAVTWRVVSKRVFVSSRDEIISRMGRSPDHLSAVMLASMDTPDLLGIEDELRNRATGRAGALPAADLQREYDPLANL